MPQFYTLPTAIGQAKMANALALGQTVNITHMAVGDGGGTLPTPNSNRTALVNEVRRAPINASEVDEQNPTWVVVEQVLPPDVGGWTIREVGIIDQEGDLIAYGNYPETYKPVLSEGSGRTQTIRFVLEVSDTAAVTLKIDPAVVLATRAYVDGRTQVATQAVVNEGENDAQIVTPKKLKNWIKQATETIAGMLKVATQAQVDAGEDDATAVTPKKLRGQLSSAEDAQALTSLNKLLTPGGLADAFKGGNQSLVRTAGYQILPGGLIIQWKTVPLAFGEGSESHQNTIAFPNGALGGVAIKDPVASNLANTPKPSITVGTESFVIGITGGASNGNQMTIILIGH
jgi:phage-related tail fiber protein